MSIPDLLSLAVIFGSAPAVGLVVLILLRLSRREPRLRVMRGTLMLALALAVIVVVFAVVFVNNGMDSPLLDTWATQVITRGTLFVVPTAAALYWLWFVWKAS